MKVKIEDLINGTIDTILDIKVKAREKNEKIELVNSFNDFDVDLTKSNIYGVLKIDDEFMSRLGPVLKEYSEQSIDLINRFKEKCEGDTEFTEQDLRTILREEDNKFLKENINILFEDFCEKLSPSLNEKILLLFILHKSFKK